MKRYFVDGIDCHWQEHPEGWWVGYEEAEAEIARLREVLVRIDRKGGLGYDIHGWIAAALKPDTGETVTINAKVGFMSSEYQAALKPDTGE